MTPAKVCKNGLANDVTFNFSNVTLPDTVVYEISYPTGGPADSLNVAITDAPSVGTSTTTASGRTELSTLTSTVGGPPTTT